MNDELRIGLVGGGRLAEAGYVPALAAARGVRLLALAEPDPGRRARVAGLARVTSTFPYAAAMLAAGGLDAVVLATPVSRHLTDARLITDAGLPVLVEKPPAPDRAGAAALAALTPAPWVGFNRRFEPANAALRNVVQPGVPAGLRLEIGYRRQGWGAHTVSDDALLDLGPHLVDLARWITRAEVTEVATATVTHEVAEFELVLGAARARVRCATNQPHRELFEVRGRDGARLARAAKGGPVAAIRGRLRPGPHPLVASLAAQLEAFAAAVRGETAGGLGTAADGVAVMAVIDAVRARAAAGRPATVTRKG